MASTIDLFILLASPLIGSFVETAYRRQSISPTNLMQRSRCNNCATPLSPLQLIPIFSYLFSRGKCAKCGAGISAYYFMTEIGFLLVTLWAFWAAPNNAIYPTIVLGWLLVILARIDFASLILPDPLNFAVALLAVSILPFSQSTNLLDHLVGGVAGFVLLWAIDAAYKRWRGYAGLGRGDAKLFGAIGLWVGLTGLPSVLLIASISGLVAAIGAALINRQNLDRRTAIAFGPWLALGGWLTWLYGAVPFFPSL